ncbi:hypothetical protein AVP41_00623 [Microbacterium sp. TNHR37B]|nr:hypothetical protein AVP41_00623 [Microbacterium sp. TNHR37B]
MAAFGANPKERVPVYARREAVTPLFIMCIIFGTSFLDFGRDFAD